MDIKYEKDSIAYKNIVENNNFEKQRQFVRVISAKGQVIEHFGPLQDLPIDISGAFDYPQKGIFREITKVNDDESIRIFTFPIIINEKVVGFVQSGQSLEVVQDTLNILILIFAVLIPVILLITLICSRWIINKTLSPLSNIAQLAEEITEKQLSNRLSIEGTDEVARLAASLDRMLDRLQNAFESNRQFTGDVSHELRTPLTIIKGEISLALQKTRNIEYYKQVLECTETEVDRLVHLVERLLQFARVDDKNSHLQISSFNVSEALIPIFKQISLPISIKNQSFEYNVPIDAIMLTDRDVFLQIVLNLLDNAVRYTPNDGIIKLHVEETPYKTTIIISDTGKGIPNEQLDKIFDRFYQTDRKNVHSNSGIGLGLAIVKKLIESLGGDIAVESIVGVGTTIKVGIPKEIWLGGSKN